MAISEPERSARVWGLGVGGLGARAVRVLGFGVGGEVPNFGGLCSSLPNVYLYTTSQLAPVCYKS